MSISVATLPYSFASVSPPYNGFSESINKANLNFKIKIKVIYLCKTSGSCSAWFGVCLV